MTRCERFPGLVNVVVSDRLVQMPLASTNPSAAWSSAAGASGNTIVTRTLCAYT